MIDTTPHISFIHARSYFVLCQFTLQATCEKSSLQCEHSHVCQLLLSWGLLWSHHLILTKEDLSDSTTFPCHLLTHNAPHSSSACLYMSLPLSVSVSLSLSVSISLCFLISLHLSFSFLCLSLALPVSVSAFLGLSASASLHLSVSLSVSICLGLSLSTSVSLLLSFLFPIVSSCEVLSFPPPGTYLCCLMTLGSCALLGKTLPE